MCEPLPSEPAPSAPDRFAAVAPPRARRPEIPLASTPAPPPPETARPAEAPAPQPAPVAGSGAPDRGTPGGGAARGRPRGRLGNPGGDRARRAGDAGADHRAAAGAAARQYRAKYRRPARFPMWSSGCSARSHANRRASRGATPPSEPTPPTVTAATPPSTPPDASQETETSLPSGPPITNAEKDGLRLAVQRCWVGARRCARRGRVEGCAGGGIGAGRQCDRRLDPADRAEPGARREVSGGLRRGTARADPLLALW